MTEAQFDKMMDMWKQEASAGGMGDMMQEWNKVWEEEDQIKNAGGMMAPKVI